MKIASDAWMFFIPVAGIAVGFFLGRMPVMGSAALIMAAFILFFFRDPERVIPAEPNAVVSPADGLLHKIDTDWFDPETGEKRTRVSIFLSVFNVHVNRFPVSGKIIKREAREGKFLAAFNHLASEDNAQVVLVIDSPYGRVGVKQIVGLIARRIVCHARLGQDAVKGERYGLMRFGSRMDVTVPSSAEIKVKVGDKVQAGSTILALLR
ncbi:MAG: phosphatidylserine decarboxylase [Nitrospinae bacterium]|nr:phosphatidylserine decarboxylase [Nitrospinota bacterium]